MERDISLKVILLQLFFLLFTRGAAGSTQQVGTGQQAGAGQETAWLSFSTHDVELVAKQHQNATLFLLLRGTSHECCSANFTYDPADPSIVPLSDLLVCPDLPSARIALPPSPPPARGCTGCGRGRAQEDREDVPFAPSPPRPSSLLLLPLQGRAPGAGGGREKSLRDAKVAANVSVEVVSRWAGKTVVGVTTNCSSVGVRDAFVRVSVVHTRKLDVASDVIGWMYTIMWDVSFLPQVILNWRRKSVEGFSFDNVALNIIAYLYYSLFNVAFYWIPYIKDQFKQRYPRGVNHVKPNDVFFATYALTFEIVLAVQCFVYGRKLGQRVSWVCIGLMAASVLAVVVDCVLAAVGVVWWLDVFYLMSYMKLIITPLKYIPQVYLIYRVKSTKGFSVSGAVMDFIGGSLSLVQMFLLSANSDDYLSIFNNFSKFGLGVISLIFNIVFFTQHLYYLRFSK